MGSWNAIEDANTLIDVGTDGFIIPEIEGIYTGVGKKAVQNVFLTHNHFDHAGGLKSIRERFSPDVYAFSPKEGVDKLLRDGQIISMGDRMFEVIHVPGHSNDSICFYCQEERVLFSGDVPLHIRTPGGSYPEHFVERLVRLSEMPLVAIYSGHDEPVMSGASEMLRESLANVRQSHITSRPA
ncbi:MAG: MBL fold metallo-hydrolase [Candidatus Riflebacteria bacterium]|nr:MBL fold metallo-hydrolase [Candidatus Riflebacteria bacterium]